MTAVLMAVCLLAGFALGWFTKRQRLGLLAENNHWVGEEIEALKGADLDADVAAERSLRLSGEQPAVEPIEVEPFMADSGYRPPRRFDDAELLGPDQLAEMRQQAECHAAIGHADDGRGLLVFCTCGFEVTNLGTQEAANDTLAWHLGQPSALGRDLHTTSPAITLDPTVEHLGQACGWSEDGETDCGDPAEGWTRWPDGTVVWLCAAHFQWVRQDVEGDGPETLPRVLPEGRVD